MRVRESGAGKPSSPVSMKKKEASRIMTGYAGVNESRSRLPERRGSGAPGRAVSAMATFLYPPGYRAFALFWPPSRLSDALCPFTSRSCTRRASTGRDTTSASLAAWTVPPPPKSFTEMRPTFVCREKVSAYCPPAQSNSKPNRNIPPAAGRV